MQVEQAHHALLPAAAFFARGAHLTAGETAQGAQSPERASGDAPEGAEQRDDESAHSPIIPVPGDHEP
ncbi:hypothetical protein Afil01_54430 [Actinorhabdospora filicis]|uniref:Uncharacterized protein n=1 Tax=Actinorhabdospora filicis TaxID=1785913 RepID=A0A9W6STV1_9ACTN|nr:hypothetical protein Afil01_54430 [Actinorhabdospora filicis]